MSKHQGLTVGSILTHLFVTFGLAVVLGQELAEGPALTISSGVVAAMGMTAVGVISAVLFRWRQRRATRGLTTGQMLAARLAEVERREAGVDAVHSRLAELEERLDFSERMLAQHDAARPADRIDT